jgi:hypothetical protein
MIPIQMKQVIVISQASTTNAETVTGTVDCAGYDFMTLDVIMATSNVVSNNPTTLKLEESDDLTTYSAITALTGDGTGGFTIPNCVTEGNWGMKFNVDLRNRKRYLKLSIAPLTTQVITAIANLGHGEESPDGTTQANVKALVEA